MLQGITRRTILELAARERLPTRVGRLDSEILHEAAEIFLTSTAGGVMPVTSIDGRPVGDGAPGPITARLRASYWDAHQGGAWVAPVLY